MLEVQSKINGKRAYFGDIKDAFEHEGFLLNGNWDYRNGFFDSILSREGAETVYLRIPVSVVDGELDHSHALLEFGTPIIVKHVVNTGIDDGSSLLDTTGLSQFQEPIDLDGELQDGEKWRTSAQKAIEPLMKYLS